MEAWFAFERKICRFLLLISGIVLAVMLLFTITDVLMRAFSKPILGGFEIISFLGAVVIGFALPYTSLYKGHVAVDFFLEIVPQKVSTWMQIITRIMVIVLFIWMGWNFILMSLDLIRTKTVTPVFRMPFYPISFGLAFCCLGQCFTLLLQIVRIGKDRDG
jgi:TRAP-type C4-dicarboxylate transport system permease small subunit